MLTNELKNKMGELQKRLQKKLAKKQEAERKEKWAQFLAEMDSDREKHKMNWSDILNARKLFSEVSRFDCIPYGLVGASGDSYALPSIDVQDLESIQKELEECESEPDSEDSKELG